MVVKRYIQLALVATLAIVAAVLVYFAVHTGGSYRPSSAAARTSPSPSVAPPSPRMLVIGDSAAAGDGASSVRRGWVSRVARGTGWQVTNVSAAGAGYLGRTAGAGVCRPRCLSLETILKRASDVATPDVVLVAAGREDVSSPDSERNSAIRSFFAALHRAYPEATIVAVNPGYDAPVAAGFATLDDDVRIAVRRVDGVFADLGQLLVGRRDRLDVDAQPNDLGHRAIARAVAARLRATTVAG